jgi:predicted transcriptional regulator
MSARPAAEARPETSRAAVEKLLGALPCDNLAEGRHHQCRTCNARSAVRALLDERDALQATVAQVEARLPHARYVQTFDGEWIHAVPSTELRAILSPPAPVSPPEAKP